MVKRNINAVEKLRSLLQVLQLGVGRADFVPSYQSRSLFYDMILSKPTAALGKKSKGGVGGHKYPEHYSKFFC